MKIVKTDDSVMDAFENALTYMAESNAKKAAKAELEMEKNFRSGDKVYLVRCPKCHKENYAMAVSSGECCWCGYNANNDKEYIKTLKEEK